jgi:hypothetical protein
MILSVIRIGLGFVSALFLFLQGMLAAEKLHAIGYAVMCQSLACLVVGFICVGVKPPPIIGFGFMALLNSFILLRGCCVSSTEELESLKAIAQGDPSGLVKITSYYYGLSFLATSGAIGIEPIKRKWFLVFAGMLAVMFLPCILVLAVRMGYLGESQTKRAVIAVGLALMSVVVGMVLRGPGRRGMSYGSIQANDATSEVIRRE